MIYRFKSTQPPSPPDSKYAKLLAHEEGKETPVWVRFRFGGAWRAGGLDMGDLNVPRTRIRHSKAKFYFTEEGFKRYGPGIIADAKEQGVPLQVIRRKNPKRSQIVYQDEYQVAILPSVKNKKKGRD